VDRAAEPVRPRKLDLLDSRLPPGSVSADGMTYWLGTDGQGRDMLSAILYGLRCRCWSACFGRDRADDRHVASACSPRSAGASSSW
jgi:ABC-type dipeptide/oligopeptide/nickel transport system permease subunit